MGDFSSQQVQTGVLSTLNVKGHNNLLSPRAAGIEVRIIHDSPECVVTDSDSVEWNNTGMDDLPPPDGARKPADATNITKSLPVQSGFEPEGYLVMESQVPSAAYDKSLPSFHRVPETVVRSSHPSAFYTDQTMVPIVNDCTALSGTVAEVATHQDDRTDEAKTHHNLVTLSSFLFHFLMKFDNLVTIFTLYYIVFFILHSIFHLEF